MQHTLANKLNYISLLVSAIVVILCTHHLSYRPDGDDQYFLNLLTTGDISSLLKARYFTWSGRIGVEYILLKTISFPLFWKVAIPLSIMITCYSLAIISGHQKNKGFFTAIALILLLLMKKSVLSDSIYWVTGFYNYLLPASLALLTMAICYKTSEFVKIAKIIPILSPFIYSYSEQVALASILSLIMILFLSKNSDKKLCFIALILTTMNFFVCYLSPGSSSRAQTEAWFAFPEYLSLNIVQKASLGIYILHTHLTDYKNYLYFTLCLYTFFISARQVKNGKTFILTSFFIALHMFLMFYVPEQYPDYISLIFSPEILSAVKPYIFILIDLLCFTSILYVITVVKENGVIISLSLLVGCISVIAMGLSPTVFASGTRTMFVMDIAVIYVILSLFPDITRKGEIIS